MEVVVDRIIIKDGLEQRLAESFETALELADGIAIAESADPSGRRAEAAPQDEGSTKKKKLHPEEAPPGSAIGQPKGKHRAVSKGGTGPHRIIFSAKFACPVSGFTIDEIEPRLFSFNSPAGACPTCDGLGTQMVFDEDLVVPISSLALNKGAIAPWSKGTSPYYAQTLQALARAYKFKISTPWEELDTEAQEVVLFGTGERDVKFIYADGVRKFETVKPFEGVIPNLERRWRETDSAWVREDLS
ncbi:MAG: hypothetical protein JKX88_04445, partial [Marinicaulis sp.]|nr:hypothetical protein [Marinicaulis sp.]